MIGRESPYSLYDQDLVTFEEGAVAYDHRDAAGFIKLNALRLRTLAQRQAEARRLTQSWPTDNGVFDGLSTVLNRDKVQQRTIFQMKLRRRRRPRRACLSPRPGDNRNFAVETADTAQEPLQRELVYAAVDQRRDVGLLEPEQLCGLGLGQTTPLEQVADLAHELRLEELLLGIGEAEVGGRTWPLPRVTAISSVMAWPLSRSSPRSAPWPA